MALTLAEVSKNVRNSVIRPYQHQPESTALRYSDYEDIGTANEVIYIGDLSSDSARCLVHFIHTGRTANVPLSVITIPHKILEDLELTHLYK